MRLENPFRFTLFLFAISLGLGATLGAGVPTYNPVSPGASVAARQESWRQLHLALYEDGFARVGSENLKVTEQGRYYRSALALDAYSDYRGGQTARTKGIVWGAAAPAVGGILGEVVGFVVGVAQTPETSLETGQWGQFQHDLLEGIGIGALIGLGIGASMAIYEGKQMQADRKKAADSFNQKLLRDINLSFGDRAASPRINLQEKF